MELKQYVAVIWKWLWLIILATGVAAGSSYLASRSAVRVYQTSTTLMVGQTISNPNPATVDLYTSQQLARTYAEMASRQPVLQAVVESLKLSVPWTVLKGQVSASVLAQTQLIEIRVIDTNPQRAKVLADEIARQLILQSPTPTDKQLDERSTFVNAQLDDLKLRIEEAKADIQSLQTSIANEVSARRIQDIQGQIGSKQGQLNIWQTNYAALLTYAKGGTNYLSVIEPASVPVNPISPNTSANMTLAASIGLVLAVAAAFFMEYLDDTIKSPDDVQRVLKASALGIIARIAPLSQPRDALITAAHPKASISEAYRVLRTNVEFAVLGNSSKALLVTSSSPQEGKTTTLGNLGVAVAQSGKRTLLVDTDLRRPTLHKLFGLTNRQGLTNLLLMENPSIDGAAQATSVPGLFILTAGPQPPNPAELLASRKMDTIIEAAQRGFDAVLFDSPPVLAVADASILAAKLREVVMIVDTGRTRSEVAQRAKQTLENSGAKVLGVVLNRLTARRSGSGYYYYDYYSSDGDEPKQKRPQKGVRAWLRRVTRPLRHRGEAKHRPGVGDSDGANGSAAAETLSIAGTDNKTPS